MARMKPELSSAKCIKKHKCNPILSKKEVPFASDLVFNAGVEKYKGKYYMIFRNDYIVDEKTKALKTNLGIAESDDGVSWTVRPKPFAVTFPDSNIQRFYDPRLTVIEDELFICFAVDTPNGVRGGIGRIKGDFEDIEILSISLPDNRNMVLFPEKIGGMYVRLERPFSSYCREKDSFDIWISKSPDLKFWGESSLLLTVNDVVFANSKIGPAAPPIKTEKGWLTTFHGVDIDETRGKNGWEERWQKRYTAGIMLLDLENPERIKAISKEPFIAAELPYETEEGFRQNVIFPGGMIAEKDGTVKIYYGASDAVECLATAKLDDILELFE